MSGTFRAVRVKEFGGPEVLTIDEVATPSPQKGQVVVDIKAAGVNPVETYIRSGSHAKKPDLPWTPGSDGAGVISAVGEDVNSFKVGDRVFLTGAVSGTYAEKAVCGESQVHALPDSVGFAEGAAIFVPYYSAYQALFHRGEAKAGETVFVHGGSGGVGVSAIQLALLRGHTVIATAGTEEGLQLLKDLGVHLALNHRSAGYIDELRAFVAPKQGVDVVLEMLANVNLATDTTILNPRGRIVVIGSRGPTQIDARLLMMANSDVRGMSLYGSTDEEFAIMHEKIGELLASGSIKPIVGKQFRLDEAPQAHEFIINPPAGATGKVVLIP